MKKCKKSISFVIVFVISLCTMANTAFAGVSSWQNYNLYVYSSPPPTGNQPTQTIGDNTYNKVFYVKTGGQLSVETRINSINASYVKAEGWVWDWSIGYGGNWGLVTSVTHYASQPNPQTNTGTYPNALVNASARAILTLGYTYVNKYASGQVIVE